MRFSGQNRIFRRFWPYIFYPLLRNSYTLEHIKTHDYTLSHTGKRNQVKQTFVPPVVHRMPGADERLVWEGKGRWWKWKNPTLFKREFQDHRGTGISLELSSTNLAWVLAGEGTATEKIDGASTKVSNHWTTQWLDVILLYPLFYKIHHSVKCVFCYLVYTFRSNKAMLHLKIPFSQRID